MAAHTERLLPYLHWLVCRPASGPLTDALLLERFVRRKDENAFAALVKRHGAMVLGVCRRVLRNAQDAEDAAQATFLVLARKAATIRRADTLAAWLHRTGHNLALKCRRADTCRREREHRRLRGTGAPSQPDPLEELSARELLAIVDEELQRLPEVYRLPLILCFLEGRTQEDAARQLGWTAGSVKGRLERGRVKLHRRLVRRGLTFPAAMLALGAMQGVAPAGMPDGLYASLARAATPMASGGGNGGFSAGVMALAEAGVGGMAVARWKALSTLLVMTGLVAVGVGLLAQQVLSLKQPEPTREGGSNGRAGGVALSNAREQPQPRIDHLGDPLPEGAVVRVGSARLRADADALITVVAFSSDGRRLAYGTENGLVHVCTAADGKPLLEFRPDDTRFHPVTELAFSPDGRTLAAGGYWSETVRLFDLATRKVRHSIPNTADGQDRWGRVWQGPGFAFTPDGRTLVLGGKDGALHLWDTATGQEHASLAGEKELVTSLTLTSDGRTALTAHGGGALHLWDVTNRKHLRKLAASAKCPHLTALAPDGKMVALAVGAAELELWDPDGGRRLQIRATAPIAGLGFTPAGASILVADRTGKIVEWDARTGKQRKSLACEGISLSRANQGTDAKPSAWFRPDGRAMAWADLSNVRPWDLTTGKETPRLALYRQGVLWAGFSADGRLLRAGGANGELGVWDSSTGRPHVPLRNSRLSWNPRYIPSPDRGKVVTVTGGYDIVTKPKPEDGRIFLWDPSGDEGPTPLREQAGPAWCAALTPDNRSLAATEATGRIRVYDAAARKPIRSFDGRKYEYHPTFSPDGAVLATTAASGTIRLYDFATGRVLHEWKGPSRTSCLAFSPDGRSLASGHLTDPRPAQSSRPGDLIYLWDTASSRELRRIPTGHGDVHALSYSPDGWLIASCGFDGVVRLWEAASGQERRHYGGHRGWVMSIDFAPDGRRLVSASLDGTALVWHVFGPVAAERRSWDLEALWSDLAKDGITAHRAMAALLTAKGTAAFLGERVKRAVKPSDDRLKAWLADLGSSAFERREAAHKEIARAGELVESALRDALQGASDAEVRRRLTGLLDGISRPEGRPEHLRDLRAVEVLEHLGGAEARLLLGELAKGAPEARLTREAKAGLTRLKGRR
jgi:RNA polymerase sigma factor (sigma-70 family)